MKHLLSVLACCFAGLLTTACDAKKITDKAEDIVAIESAENTEAIENQNLVQSIQTEDFISRICDFRQNKDWKYKGERPCVIDFYADWCRPCQAMAPLMEKLAAQYQGQVDFYRVNVDNCPELAERFNISAIPFFLFCPMEGTPSNAIGGMGEEEMVSMLENIR